MKKRVLLSLLLLLFSSCVAQPEATSSDDTGGDGATSSCTLTENTSEISEVSGCALLERDTSGCEQERLDAGLSGIFLNFSCRVSLAIVSSEGQDYVQAESDGLPDYKSHYFNSDDDCYDADMAGDVTNPNTIEV